MESTSAEGVSDSLYIIASQAFPKVCAEFGLQGSPDPAEVSGRAPERSKELERRRVGAFSALFQSHGLGWSDVFSRSDIGAERRMVAEFVPKGSSVLDVGCGRGYFTFACFGRAGSTVSLDIMDGESRKGWWRQFGATGRALGLGGALHPVRASAVGLPFRSGSFEVVASVHAIRNVDPADLRALIDEAFRVTAEGGRLVIAESIIDERDRGAYAELFRIRVSMGWEHALPRPEELCRRAGAAGFREVGVQVLNTDLRYAPVSFPFDASRMEGLRGRYEAAIAEVHAIGERHPPVFILTAKR